MRGFGNMGGLGNMGNLMKQAQKAMEQARKMEEELAALKVEGSAGGGMVKVEATAAGTIEGIKIDPQVVDPEDVEMLQDLILSAIHDATEKSAAIKQERINELTGGLPIPPGLFPERPRTHRRTWTMVTELDRKETDDALCEALARLVGELEKLPGIGPKSAQRLAFHLLRIPRDEARQLSDAILEVKERIGVCSQCFNYTDQPVCDICRNDRRDRSLLCVVAEPRDLLAMERTNEFSGRYHVLGGVISPMEGIGPEMLRIRELMERIESDGVKEVILATNPTVEGSTTALYLARLIKPFGVRVTKIAFGLPVGGDLDYADQATLVEALEGRREM